MVVVDPGRWPVSTGVRVFVNATQIGGSATLELADDATGCDDIRDDYVFIGCASVPLSIPAGTYNLPVTVTDAQGRSATPGFSIAATVVNTSPGTILGTLVDGSSAVLPGASVTLRNTATLQEWTVMTDGVGVFRFINLPPGTYEITSPVTRTNIQLSGGTLNLGNVGP
jgi:hypothetical protein